MVARVIPGGFIAQKGTTARVGPSGFVKEGITGGTPATAVTFSGPSSGVVLAASTNFVISVDNPTISGTLVVTPATDISGGGTFAPTTVSLTTGSPSATVVFTPAKSGVHTLTCSDDGGLTDPTPLTYTVTPVVSTTLVASPTDGTTQNSLTGLKWKWWDTPDPADAWGAPDDEGTTETTDGSGVLTIPLPNSALTNGEVGFLLVTDSDGTDTQSPPPKVTARPLAVT